MSHKRRSSDLLNLAQRAILTRYEKGRYKKLADITKQQALKRALKEANNPLLTFMLQSISHPPGTPLKHYLADYAATLATMARHIRGAVEIIDCIDNDGNLRKPAEPLLKRFIKENNSIKAFAQAYCQGRELEIRTNKDSITILDARKKRCHIISADASFIVLHTYDPHALIFRDDDPADEQLFTTPEAAWIYLLEHEGWNDPRCVAPHIKVIK